MISYNELVHRVDSYLRRKRESSALYAWLLPGTLFREELWRWERRGVAIGASWGVFWAFAPVPLQTIFAVLSCIRRRGNIPLGVAFCWLSFPGYQILAWPLQWWVGAGALGLLFPHLTSGATPALIRQAAVAIPEGWEQVRAVLGQVDINMLIPEFLLGCFLTCTGAALVTYGLLLCLWRKR